MRPDTRSRRLCRLPGIVAGVALAVQAAAVPPLVTVTSIQPSSAPSVPDEDYEPAAPAAFVVYEPTAYPTPLAFGHRVTVDLTVRNDEPDYIRLDEYETFIGGWNADLVEQDLLAMPETLLQFPLGPDDNRRPALTNGGFAVSGLKLEHHVMGIETEPSLTFGEALDVVPYDLDDGAGYLVAGSQQFLLGEVPTSVEDPPPRLGRRGFIAKYNAAGAMSAALPTTHDEASAIADLGNGLYLVAGRHSQNGDGLKVLMLSRVRSWETVDGDSTDLDTIEPNSDYGADEENERTLVPFYDGGKPCEVERAIDATVAEKGSYHIVAVELDCSTGLRIGILVTLADGTPLQSFGSSGSKVFAGPGVVDAVPVGVETQKLTRGLFPPGTTKERWVWLGAAVGPECQQLGDACSFGLTRIDYVTGAMHKAGWYTPADQSYFDGARPRDMALDTKGRPVMAGVARFLSGNRYVAVHRFQTDGTSDAMFGVSGWATHSFDGHDGDAYAVRPRRNGEIALAVLSEEDTPAGLDWSMAMMNLTAVGTLGWQHSPYADDSFTHMSVRTKLNYGYRYETKVSSLPWAITEDWSDRLVMVGFGGSDHLQNPCEEEAEEQNEPLLNYGGLCGGPWTIALARYLPFGEPDSRRWLAPAESRSMVVPSDQHFGDMPSYMNLVLHFDGFTAFNIPRVMVPFQNAIADFETNSYGAYRFPFDSWILNFDERFRVKAHPLDHHHRNASGNRFAYDIDIVRWSGSGWTDSTTDESVTVNEEELMWGRGVRAVAGGKVVACRRSTPDNPFDVIESSDANFVKIQHVFDPFDLTKAEYISYLHFRQDSVPLDVCPNICPVDSPVCDPETEGVDPDGAELPTPVDVLAGQFIGSAGNSGNSTAPHLHVHMSTGESSAGSYPLLFHEVMLQSEEEGPDGPTWPVDNAAILHESLAFPTD